MRRLAQPSLALVCFACAALGYSERALHLPAAAADKAMQRWQNCFSRKAAVLCSAQPHALCKLQFVVIFAFTRAERRRLQVFSKPFVAALDGHSDGLYCLARNPRTLNSLLSGSADGEIRLWDLPSQRTLRRLLGHTRAGAESAL